MQRNVVLITGCSSGFGRAMTRAFLNSGWHVLATMRNAASKGEELAREFEAFKDQLDVFTLDVTKEADRKQVVQFIRSKYGGHLACLVNNAGQGLFGSLEDLSEEELRGNMEVNFFGAALLTRALLPALRAAKGRVINISSVWGRISFPLTSGYNASKFALEGLSEALHHELAPHGVQVALVEPGAFATSFSASSLWAKSGFSESSPYLNETLNWHDERSAKDGKSGADPEKVAALVADLARKKQMPLRTGIGVEANLMKVMKILPQWIAVRFMGMVFKGIFHKPRAAQVKGNDIAA